ncbi:MAG TPA: hypothetical protein VEC57_04820 [Candidatus Limnocylindrales bacterium]|nr:hypothetical protein [Candidatus Limnocylindrales bacterium]
MAEPFVVLVSGRGALTRLAGVPSVVRHVAAAHRLRMTPVVVVPASLQALLAEIAGLIGTRAQCISAPRFAEGLQPGDESRLAMVVSAEWYLSLGALLGVRARRERRVLARVCERGAIAVPLGRISLAEARAVAARLASVSASTALAELLEHDGAVLDLNPRDEQRLSDNVSAAHAESKLVETLFGAPRGLGAVRVKRRLAAGLARVLSATPLRPARLATLKLFAGLTAAWILGGTSYEAGIAGALLFLGSRVLGAAAAVMARAGFADSGLREKLELAGDTVVHIAMLWSVAGGPAGGGGALALAAIATIGLMISTALAYIYVLHDLWTARERAGSYEPSSDEFVSRFTQRDGIAYALLFAALIGRLDLLLWGAAVASHLFYLLWLLARQRAAARAVLRDKPA